MLFDSTIRFKDKHVRKILGPWYESTRDRCIYENHSEQFAKLVQRVLANAIDNDDFYSYCPLYSEILRKEFGRGINKEIMNTTLLEMKPHDQLKHICRGFRISKRLVDILWSHENFILYYGSIKRKNKFYYRIGNTNASYPELVCKAIRNISHNPFYLNFSKAKGYFDQMRMQLKNSDNEEERRRYIQRYLNDYIKMATLIRDVDTTVLNRNDKEVIETYCKYYPQKGGRIQETNGGFQICTRILKEFLLHDMGYINYDLKKSQLNCLKKLFDDYGLPKDDIDYLLNNMDDIIEYVGLKEGDFKDCLYAFIMGSPLKNYSSIDSTICNSDRKYSKNETFRRFSQIVKPIHDNSVLLLNYILMCKNKKHYKKYYGKWTIMNDCGMPFLDCKIDRKGQVLYRENDYDVGNKKQYNELRRRLMSFMLTGIETNFIHHLTQICSNHGISVVANEHDGLITDDYIDQSLVKEAIEKSGFTYADLKIKPICKQEELNDWNMVI